MYMGHGPRGRHYVAFLRGLPVGGWPVPRRIQLFRRCRLAGSRPLSRRFCPGRLLVNGGRTRQRAPRAVGSTPSGQRGDLRRRPRREQLDELVQDLADVAPRQLAGPVGAVAAAGLPSLLAVGCGRLPTSGRLRVASGPPRQRGPQAPSPPRSTPPQRRGAGRVSITPPPRPRPPPRAKRALALPPTPQPTREPPYPHCRKVSEIPARTLSLGPLEPPGDPAEPGANPRRNT